MFDEQYVRHKCPECGEVWWATMFFDLGGWFYQKDEEGYCPNGCEVDPELD